MKTYKLHLIRHGLTQGNEDGIYMGGGTDMPLSENGINQLRDLAARYTYPNVGAVYASPMKRALQTAEILYPGVQNKTIVEDLRECLFGAYEGKHFSVLMKDPQFMQWMNPKSDFVPEGGESGQQFAQRTATAVLAVMENMAQSGIFEAACVSHGGVIMTALAQLGMPKTQDMTQLMVQNGCGFTVQAGAGMLMRDQMVEIVGRVPLGWQLPNAK